MDTLINKGTPTGEARKALIDGGLKKKALTRRRSKRFTRQRKPSRILFSPKLPSSDGAKVRQQHNYSNFPLTLFPYLQQMAARLI